MIVNTGLNPMKSGISLRLPDFYCPFWLLKLRRVAAKYKAVLMGVHILTVISLSGAIVKGFQNKNSGAGM